MGSRSKSQESLASNARPPSQSKSSVATPELAECSPPVDAPREPTPVPEKRYSDKTAHHQY